MKKIFVSICVLSLIIAIRAVVHQSNQAEGNLNSDYQYRIQGDPEDVQGCTKCTFINMKTIEECMVTGYISIQKITRVNVNDPSDKLVQYKYLVCESESYSKYSLYIFIVLLFVALKIFLSKLNDYRGELEHKIYQKLSLSKP